MRMRAALLAIAILGGFTSIAETSGPPVAFFGTPTAEASLGEPVTFSTTFTASGEPRRVELLVRLPDSQAVTVLPAAVSGSGGAYTATAVLEGHQAPNTTFVYRFRARGAGPTALGPEAQVTVSDERFEWRTLTGNVVRLHWYSGDEAFAQRALQIGDDAVERATELLGVANFAPVDFFIYDDEADFRVALGPGTRENVGGQAHADIRTMFGLIEPNEINSDWVDTLVAHELTHLVFNTATDNPFHAPPRWLNEGVAVYLSEGNSVGWRDVVDRASDRGAVIPLDGLAGLFPTTFDEFRLAYGESVSAVDFFVTTHGEEKLWALVRSYAQGVSDDEAFITATGADVAAFNAAWMASLDVDVPPPFGPQPGQLGPLPADWVVGATPTPGPGGTSGPRPTATPSRSPSIPPGMTVINPATLILGVAVLLLALLIVGVIVGIVLIRRNARRPPPGPWQPPGQWPPSGAPPPGQWPPPQTPAN